MQFIEPANLPATGHPMIDEGHRRLAEIVNELYSQWTAGETAGLVSTARRFTGALRQHFRQEEAVMADIDLPSATEHCRAHDAVGRRFEDLVEQMAQAPVPPAAVMVDFFTAAENLVWDHEMVDDQDFWAYFAGRGKGPGTLILEAAPQVLGLEAIDQDHATLVGLLNQLHVGVTEAHAPSVLMARASGLRHVAAAHFADEERLMRATPGARDEAHIHQHARLLTELDAALEDMACGRRATLEAIIGAYLRDWLLEHIDTFDRRLVVAVQSSGLAARAG